MARGIKGAKKKNGRGSHRGKEPSSSSPPICTKVWKPGVDELKEEEELHYDPSAYNCLHAFDIGWPCLSFDVLPDSLGLIRTGFPHTIYAVAGTQAKKTTWNYIGVFKLANISGKKRKLIPETSTDGDSNTESDGSSDEEEIDEESSAVPVLALQRIAHHGCVNRIRAMPQDQRMCVSWAEAGYVQIWDMRIPLANLETNKNKRPGGSLSVVSPLMKFDGHSTEGFAIDWNPFSPGTLVSGDCNGSIHLWEPSSGTWTVHTAPFAGHSGSVEDLQWSPESQHVFASCSTDKTVAVWDIRSKKSPELFFQAHESDINVISWNRHQKGGKELASGSDDGSFSIHDLRVTTNGTLVDFLHRSEYHKYPITSIEWNPYNETGLAVSSSDDQLTIWDFSLERDEEEESAFKLRMKDQVDYVDDLPAHLLFVHQGQKDMKELHWHPRVEGMLLSTAADGFNVLMPSNICQSD